LARVLLLDHAVLSLVSDEPAQSERLGPPAARGKSVFPIGAMFKESPVKVLFARMWKEDDAVLAFEWVLLVTLLTIGIVGGVAAARDAIIDELGDVAQAMLSVDQSYTINFPLGILVHAAATPDGESGTADSSFTDDAVFSDCGRVSFTTGQGPSSDDDGGGI
jgi:Flp pilus assembly pilin Flp